MTANANVVANIEVAATPLEFGNVTRQVGKAINVDLGIYKGVAGGAAESVGIFTVEKGPNTQVTLTLTLPAFLANTTSQLPISFANGDEVLAELRTGSTETPWDGLQSGPNVRTLSTGAASAFFASEVFTLALGGDLSPSAATTLDGAHTGTITLLVDYN
jgi:hypothetical protein